MAGRLSSSRDGLVAANTGPGISSNEPMSHTIDPLPSPSAARCRMSSTEPLTRRWSHMPQYALSAASIAGLPAWIACVRVGPPFEESGPSSGSTFDLSAGPASAHEPS